MKTGSPTRVAAAGALVAAVLGCAAGTLLRPDVGAPRGGPALIVSPAPVLAEVASYEDSWWTTHVDHDTAY